MTIWNSSPPTKNDVENSIRLFQRFFQVDIRMFGGDPEKYWRRAKGQLRGWLEDKFGGSSNVSVGEYSRGSLPIIIHGHQYFVIWNDGNMTLE